MDHLRSVPGTGSDSVPGSWLLNVAKGLYALQIICALCLDARPKVILINVKFVIDKAEYKRYNVSVNRKYGQALTVTSLQNIKKEFDNKCKAEYNTINEGRTKQWQK